MSKLTVTDTSPYRTLRMQLIAPLTVVLTLLPHTLAQLSGKVCRIMPLGGTLEGFAQSAPAL